MKNFLKETKEALEEAKKTPSDIVFIGSFDWEYEVVGGWSVFLGLADELYDAGYGTAMVSSDLVIRFSDGSWLDRTEYDGSEWWSYQETPGRPDVPPKNLTKLIGGTIFEAGTCKVLMEGRSYGG